MTKTVGMVSLGCDKNRVDAEEILATFRQAGYRIVGRAEDADVLIVNTCAFIDAAKKESIDAVFEYAARKKAGAKLVVTGCLPQRYGADFADAIPEGDVFVGINGYDRIVETVEGGIRVSLPDMPPAHPIDRVLTTPPHYAYLKIADGCNNFCSYCAIPMIRGRYRSYPAESLLKEAERLAAEGVKELIVVAQDTTRYGTDLYGENRLKPLLKDLLQVGFEEIRLMYAYPESIDRGLIELIASEQRIASYLDVPLQHIDSGVLKRMNRRIDEEGIRRLIAMIKETDPSFALRSSFIVGFPGESDDAFRKLKDFIAEGNIDYAGFFAYSKEEGTRAASMPDQIRASVKKSRQKELIAAQSEVVLAKHNALIGKILPVRYEGIDVRRKLFYGRTPYNAPEIDTKVYFTSERPVDIGQRYAVRMTDGGFHPTGEAVFDLSQEG